MEQTQPCKQSHNIQWDSSGPCYGHYQGRVYSPNQLLDSVKGDDVYVGMRTADVHIKRLRKAINITGGPDIIQTVRSMGHSFGARD